MGITRRQFIALAGGAAAVAAGSGLTSRWWGLDPDPLKSPDTDGDKVVASVCEMCFWKCGIQAHVKNGRLMKVVGNPAHPLSRGRLCPRGVGALGLAYDPDRLTRPQLRREKRGEQVFETVSWDAALSETAAKLDQVRRTHGPEALALFVHGHGGSWFQTLVAAYGTPNVGQPSYAQCRGPRDTGFALTFGQGVGSPEATDIANARCLVLIGSHLGENMHNTQVQDFAKFIASGGDLIVVDPRFSTAAGKARWWLPIKPGTDTALLLAWMHVIVNENRHDADYLSRYAIGLDALKAHLRDKTPEWSYTHTGIQPETIVETARAIAGARPAALIHPGRHVAWYGNDTQRSRAIAILTALLGSWGHRGGYALFPKMALAKYPLPPFPRPARAIADAPKGKPWPFAEEGVASGLRDAAITGTADYDVKAFMLYGTNLLQSLPEPAKTVQALQQVDFSVAIDILPTEITGWADVVLPEASYLERTDDLHNPAWREPYVALRQPVVEPPGEAKPGWWIAKELAHRLGLDPWFPWKDIDEYLATRASASNIDLAALRSSGVVGGAPRPSFIEDGVEPAFDTPSKRIELFSQRLADAGLGGLPAYEPPEEPPQGSFRLIYGRSPAHTFGRTTNNRVLGEIASDNEVWLNARAAKELGVDNGQLVVLVNQDEVRSNPVRVKVTQRIRPDCVYLVHGFGHESRFLRFARGKGVDDTKLMSRQRTDPATGATGMRVNFVRVERHTA